MVRKYIKRLVVSQEVRSFLASTVWRKNFSSFSSEYVSILLSPAEQPTPITINTETVHMTEFYSVATSQIFEKGLRVDASARLSIREMLNLLESLSKPADLHEQISNSALSEQNQKKVKARLKADATFSFYKGYGGTDDQFYPAGMELVVRNHVAAGHP